MRAVGNRSFSLLSSLIKDSTINLILSVSVSEKEFSIINLQHNSQQLERRDPWELLADSYEEGDSSGDVYSENGRDDDELSTARVEDHESDGTKDERLRNNITEIPQTKGIDAMAGTADEESERDFDDDQMIVMDDHLALMFKDRVKGKKDKGAPSRLAQAASTDGYPRRCTEGSHTFQKPDYGSFGHLR
jgi:DNA polymerase phi